VLKISAKGVVVVVVVVVVVAVEASACITADLGSASKGQGDAHYDDAEAGSRATCQHALGCDA